MGLFVEANYLVETDFSYHRLVYEEKRFLDGGPAVYVTSIMPTLLAMVMKVAPSTKAVFVIGHLFTFACAAAVAVLAFGLLYRHTGTMGAALIATAIITTPVFAVQIDMIGMDLPLAAMGLVVAGYLSKRRYVTAGAAAMFAFAIKLSGAVLTASTACFFLVLLIFARWKSPAATQRRMWIGAGVALLLIALQLLSANWRSSLPTAESDDWDTANAQGWKSLAPVLEGCPEVVVVAVITALLSMVTVAVWLFVRYRAARLVRNQSLVVGLGATGSASARIPHRSGSGTGRASGTPSLGPEAALGESVTLHAKAIQDAIVRHPLPLFAWIVIVGTLTGVMLTYTIPRYLVLPIPLLYATCGLLLFARRRLRPLAGLLVAALIVFNVANTSGRFLPPVAVVGTDSEYDRRTGALLERSREYLGDHRDNLRVIELIQRDYPDRAIVAGNPFSYFLSLPRLGYVEEPRHGYTPNTFSNEHFVPLEEILENPPSSVIVIRPTNRFLALGSAMLPPPEEHLDEVLLELGDDQSLIVYLRRWPHDLSPEQLRWRTMQWLWPAQANVELARKHIDVGNLVAAKRELLLAVEISPKYADAHHELGVLYSRLEQLDLAEQEFLEAARLDPGRAKSFYQLGMVQWKLDKQDLAVANFQHAIDAEPNFVPAQLQLALIDRHQGRWSKAAARYRDIIESSPPQRHAIAAANALARVLATATDEAIRNPQEAIEWAEWACRSTNFENRECLETLAIAYHAAGRTDEEQQIRDRLQEALR